MLTEVLMFLAAVPGNLDADDQNRFEALRRNTSGGNADTFLVLGAIVILTAATFFWAFFIRKRPQTIRGSIVIEKRKKGESSERFSPSGRRRRRRRRPDHPDNLPRNPTLMETGGLPPIRPEEPEAPPSTGSPQTP